MRHGSRVRHIWWSLARVGLSLPALSRRSGHGVTISTNHAGVTGHATGSAHHVHIVHALLHPGVHVHAAHHHGVHVHVVAHLIWHPHLITKRILGKRRKEILETFTRRNYENLK